MGLNRVAIIGCGGMARHHIRQILKQADTTKISVLCEPSEEQYKKTAEIFSEFGTPTPPNQPDLARLLADYPLDTAFIITPHANHFDQTAACMQAGVDVLLEKPMVMNADRSPRADQDSRPYRPAARGGFSGQPLSPDP